MEGRRGIGWRCVGWRVEGVGGRGGDGVGSECECSYISFSGPVGLKESVFSITCTWNCKTLYVYMTLYKQYIVLSTLLITCRCSFSRHEWIFMHYNY